MARKGTKRAAMAVAAFAGATAMVLGQGFAANAAESGSHGCGSQVGWLETSFSGGGSSIPPGSVREYVWYSTSGTFKRSAQTNSGFVIYGGGIWHADGETLHYATPYCQPFGR